jgi:hypothetical protein
MKRYTLVAAAVALGLVGCGGDSSDPASTPQENTFTLTAIDGYLVGAEIYADRNLNGTADSSELIGTTDSQGKITFSATQSAYPIIVKAIPGSTLDTIRGPITEEFELKAPKGFETVSPLTNLVSKQLDENPELSVAEAKQTVVLSITSDDMSVDSDDLFTDYIANLETDIVAKAINAIGEALVDLEKGDALEGVTVDQVLDAVSQVADILEQDIDNGIDENFAPEIDFDSDSITVVENYRPEAIGSINPQTIDFEQAIEPIDVSELFEDADNDALTFELGSDSATLNGLSINGSTISGTPETAGELEFWVVASDGKAKSKPITFMVSVIVQNDAPVIDESIQLNVQSQLSLLELTQGEVVNEQLDIMNLFTDADDDALQLSIEQIDATFNLSVLLTDDQLQITGTPAKNGEFSFVVSATDGINEQAAEASFSVDVAEAIVEVKHPLEDTVWYYTEHGSSDGIDNNEDYTRVWCEAMQLTDGKVYIAERTPENRTQCDSISLVEFANASYVVEDDVMSVTFIDEDETQPQTIEFEITADGSSIADGAKLANVWGEIKTLYASEDDVVDRITLTSDQELDFATFLPNPNGGSNLVGTVSASLSRSDNENYEADADLFFDNASGYTIDCALLEQHYDEFLLSGNFQSGGKNVFSTSECYDGQGHASMDFDTLDGFVNGEVYSLIAKSNSDLPDLHFNIKWTDATFEYEEVTDPDAPYWPTESTVELITAADYLVGHFFDVYTVNTGDYNFSLEFFTNSLDLYEGSDTPESISVSYVDNAFDVGEGNDDLLYVSNELALVSPTAGDLQIFADIGDNGFASTNAVEAMFAGNTFYVLYDDGSNIHDDLVPRMIEMSFEINGSASFTEYNQNLEIHDQATTVWSINNDELILGTLPEAWNWTVTTLSNNDVSVLLFEDKPYLFFSNETAAKQAFMYWADKQ